MHRRAPLALGATLAFTTGLAVAACGQGDAPEKAADTSRAAPEAVETAQTTPATQPVVTVYKSPT